MPDSSQHPDKRFAALDDALAWTWDALAEGASSSKHAYHAPVLATVDPGGRPAARVVVLRRVDAATRTLLCHSDARSPKVEQVQAQPLASWVFWSPAEKIQLRLDGDTSVHHHDAIADRQWEQATVTSRRCYLAPHPPSVEAQGPSPNLPEDVRGEAPTAERVAAGRDHFVVLQTVVRAIDWLYLHHTGHRRARFAWDEAGGLESTWLQP